MRGWEARRDSLCEEGRGGGWCRRDPVEWGQGVKEIVKVWEVRRNSVADWCGGGVVGGAGSRVGSVVSGRVTQT